MRHDLYDIYSSSKAGDGVFARSYRMLLNVIVGFGNVQHALRYTAIELWMTRSL